MLPKLETIFGVGALFTVEPACPMKTLRLPPISLSQIVWPSEETFRPGRSELEKPVLKFASTPGSWSVS